MTIHDELIAKTLMAKPTTDEEWLNIDWDTRLITIPSTLTNIGVYNDKDTNRLYFRCPIEYGEFKIADFGIHVNYQNTGVSATKYDGDVYFVDDVESDGEYLTFSWLVGRHAYLEEGTTAFIVCCKVVDSDDNVVNELNTTVATLSVLEGLEVDVLPPEDYPDYLEELLRRVEAAEETANSVDAKATEALEKAESAQQKAQSAEDYCDQVDDKARAAQSTANEALEKADSAIQGINVNGTPAEVKDHVAELNIEAGGGIYFGTCSTDSYTAIKEVDCPDVTELYAGLTIMVYFENASTLGESRLDVNGTGDYPIVDSYDYDTMWGDSAYIMLSYDGENALWRAFGFKDSYVTDIVAVSNNIITIHPQSLVMSRGTQLTIPFTEDLEGDLSIQLFGKTFPINGISSVHAGESYTFVFDGQQTFTYSPDTIQSITVNGESVPVEGHTAEIEVEGSKPTVDGETLIF